MKLIINNIKLSLNEDTDKIKYKTAKKLNIKPKDFISFRILKESIDARKKSAINLIYSVAVEIEDTQSIKQDNDIKQIIDDKKNEIVSGNLILHERPVIVGSGPAGLFTALLLSQYGYKPLLIERGDDVEKRGDRVKRYWTKGELDTESNVQFGEGGAGTFSDGKLTTRINDKRCEQVFLELIKSGIPEEILYKAKPHLGTDNLKNIVVNIRKKIIKNGGEVRFRAKMTSINIKDNKVKSITINQNEIINTEVVILAIGHSSRDTFKLLSSSGLTLLQKPFSVGVRIEHPQSLIDFTQFGKEAGHPKLGHAEYSLFHKVGLRTVYSFCMCPGGVVTASASEFDTIVTNGMSEFARDKQNANSAWVVSVNPDDFGSSDPLAGVEFQRGMEKSAFRLGGNNNAPIQMLSDFLSGSCSNKIGTVHPSYTGGTKLSDLNLCLPDFISIALKESVGFFDKKLNGFAKNDALLTGVETRTSSPIRILRDESFQAMGISGLYPAGEGAGYAGGIVSAAVDGIRVAEQIIKTYKPLN